MRPRPLRADLQQPAARRCQTSAEFLNRQSEPGCALLRAIAGDQDIPLCKHVVRIVADVALRLDAIVVIENLCCFFAQGGGDFSLLPQIKPPFTPLAVGILGGEELPLLAGHLLQHIAQDVARHLRVSAVVGDLPGFQVGAGQLRLIVEHLFKMGHMPFIVHGIAVETAAEVVVQPAAGHFAQSEEGHLQGIRRAGARVIAEHEIESDRTREFGGAAKAPMLRLEAVFNLLIAGVEQGPDRRAPLAGLHSGHLLQFLRHPFGRIDDGVALFFPGLRDAQQDRAKARPSAVILRREISAAGEGLEVGGQPDAHGPAAPAGRRLHKGHIDVIDIGALLAVHLDGHEVVVQNPGDLGILERLVLHHMTPVAGRVAHREKDRFIFPARPVKGLLAPGVPRHGIAGMLEQIGAFLMPQAVGGGGLV